MGKRTPWVRSLAVICIVAMAVLTAWVTARIQDRRTAQSARQHQNNIVKQFMTAVDRTVRDQQEWAAEDFFSDDASIRACEAISNRDLTQLQSLIDAGLDVNATGKSGLTLLHWALFEGNFEAFQLLLRSGADPDKKLKRFIFLHNGTALVEGDSILFTSMRSYYSPDQLNYFLAALEHSSQADPRDAEGNSLLLVVLRERAVNQALLAPIIERKLELEKANPDYPQKEEARLLEWLERYRESDEPSRGGEP
jgi:hypothetical protein